VLEVGAHKDKPHTSRSCHGDAEAFLVVTNEQVLKGLILAQSERWRRGLGMQVERRTGFGWS
jgi:hypothetical protein